MQRMTSAITRMTMAYMAYPSLTPMAHNCFPIRYRHVPIALFSIPRYAPQHHAARIDSYTEANSTGGHVRRSLYTFPINRKGEMKRD